MDREEAKEYIKANPEIYFKPARKSGYICPICQNGTGKDGTGITEIKGKEGLYKCFKCDFSGDVFDFIAEENKLDIKSDFPKVMDIARNIYGISGDNSNPKKKREHNMKHSINKHSDKPSGTALEPDSTSVETDFIETGYFKKVTEHKNAHDYLRERGISEVVQKRFQIGYDPKWRCLTNPNVKPIARIIIPTSKNSYLARAACEVETCKAMKVGKVHIFNVAELDEESRDPIFVCEGEIDALSVIEAGGKAVGLGGTSFCNSFIAELEKRKMQARLRPLLICLDNDDAGKKATEGLKEKLKQKGYSCRNVCEELLAKKNENEGYKDPNEALVADKDGFKEKVAAANAQAVELFEEDKKNYRQEYMDKVSNVLTSFYIKKETIETGVKELDKFLDGGLHAGLYVLAATSGAGKTTLALQIADNIAKNKQDVLFFSGEMTINEIMAKSLSRLSKEMAKDNDRNVLTMRTILNIATSNNSDYEQRVKELITENYYGIAEHIRIYDGLQEIKDIKNKIEEHKRRTGNNPVIFIDYLQIIKTENAKNEKRLQVDEIVSQLRIAAAEYETPIFVISSLNREAYGRERGKKPEDQTPASERELFASDLKESGGIEYGADVIITLQADNDERDEDVRNMKVRIIKNRTGKRHKKNEYISLAFYTRFNYFEEIQKPTNNQNDKKEIKFIGDKVVE